MDGAQMWNRSGHLRRLVISQALSNMIAIACNQWLQLSVMRIQSRLELNLVYILVLSFTLPCITGARHGMFPDFAEKRSIIRKSGRLWFESRLCFAVTNYTLAKKMLVLNARCFGQVFRFKCAEISWPIKTHNVRCLLLMLLCIRLYCLL